MILRIIKIAISIIYCLAYKLYKYFFYLINGEYPGKLIILTYHSVKESDAYKFEKQMSELINTGETISIDSINEIGHGGEHFSVTFDDGYQSVLKYAIPIMKKKIFQERYL